jgi:hypothetical protein
MLKKLHLGPEGRKFFKLFFFCGISTVPTIFIRFLPRFCFLRSFCLRVTSPPDMPSMMSLRYALMVSRATTRRPRAAWSGISNWCRGISLRRRFRTDRPRCSAFERCEMNASASTGFA